MISNHAKRYKNDSKILCGWISKIFHIWKIKTILYVICWNQLNWYIWWRSTKFRSKINISPLSEKIDNKNPCYERKSKCGHFATKILNIRPSTWHTAAGEKFWKFKLQNRFIHAISRGSDPIFRYFLVNRTCFFIWTGPNKFLTILLISGFI